MIGKSFTRTNEQSITEPIHAVYGDGGDFQSIDMSGFKFGTSQITTPQNAFSVDSLSLEEESLKKEQSKKLEVQKTELAQKIADIEQGMKLAEFPQMEYGSSSYVNRKISELIVKNQNQPAQKLSINMELEGEDNSDDDQEDDGEKNGQKVLNNDGKLKNVKTKASLHSSSSLQSEEYWNQDVEKRQEEQFQKAVSDITSFKTYFIKFRFRLFFEFFFYHSLFMMFFGPIGNPLLYYFGKGLTRNLMFWGKNFPFFYQFTAYLWQAVAIGLYAYYPTPYIKFQAEIIYLFVGMVYRISTIAVKYATYDLTKIRALKDNVFSPEELGSDFFLRDWRDQTNRIIYEEIYFAQRAYEIDTSWFYIEFIKKPEEATIQALKDNNKALSEFYKHSDQKFEPTPIHTCSPETEPFYVYGIIKLLVDSFQKEHAFSISFVQKLAKIYAILRVLIPTVYKIIEFGMDYFKHSQWYEYFISAAIAYLSFLFFYFTIWTLLQGIIDMKRKIFLMEQMAFMISPRKIRNIDSKKLLPTINIFKSSNIKAWQLMRHICQEYGKRYDIRVQSYFSGVVLTVVISIIILCLQYTDIIRLENCFIVILLIETVLALIMFIMILSYGAQINEMFDIHNSILNQNKSVLLDIYRMRRRYFCQEFKTTNYLYSRGVEKIRQEVATLKLENPCAHIKEIVEAYDTHIDELKFDQHQNPFQIGSITITNGTLESGVIGIVSIVIAIVGKFLSSRLES